MFRVACFALSTVLIAIAPARAAVLALAPTPHGENLRVIDLSRGGSTVLQATSCCAVQSGTVTADAGHHRVFWLSNRTGGADLYTFTYAGASPGVTSVPLAAGPRVTHLAYDALGQQLVGLATDASGAIEIVTVAPASGNVVLAGTLDPGCCTLRTGPIAFMPLTRQLLAVGRRSGDGTDHLLQFSVSAGTLHGAFDLGSESATQLVADGSTLYALSYATDTALLRPGTFTFSPSFAFTPIGPGTSACCFALAGPAAIDHTANALVSLTAPLTAPTVFATRAFSLDNGAMTIGAAATAMGLFEDATVPLLDRIFADGFE